MTAGAEEIYEIIGAQSLSSHYISKSFYRVPFYFIDQQKKRRKKKNPSSFRQQRMEFCHPWESTTLHNAIIIIIICIDLV